MENLLPPANAAWYYARSCLSVCVCLSPRSVCLSCSGFNFQTRGLRNFILV